MRGLVVLAGVAAAAAWSGPAASQSDRVAEAGALFEKRCASCHALPDPALRTDRAWLERVRDTAWTDTPKGARAALVKWLGSDERKRPPRVDAPARDAKGLGVVASDVKTGSVVLHGPQGDVTLVWDAGDKDRRRMLAPGAYRVRTTRVEREEKGVAWFLSATAAPNEVARAVKAGRTLRLDVSTTVRFEGQVRRRGDAMQLGFSVKDAEGRGLSVYRDGKRVPVTYKVLSKRGEVLAEGTMNYGWGGGGWASVRPSGKPARVEYAIPTGPFPLRGATAVEVE